MPEGAGLGIDSGILVGVCVCVKREREGDL